MLNVKSCAKSVNESCLSIFVLKQKYSNNIKEDRLGIIVKPFQVRLIPNSNNPYAWKPLPEKEELFKSMGPHILVAIFNSVYLARHNKGPKDKPIQHLGHNLPGSSARPPETIRLPPHPTPNSILPPLHFQKRLQPARQVLLRILAPTTRPSIAAAGALALSRPSVPLTVRAPASTIPRSRSAGRRLLADERRRARPADHLQRAWLPSCLFTLGRLLVRLSTYKGISSPRLMRCQSRSGMPGRRVAPIVVGGGSGRCVVPWRQVIPAVAGWG